MCLLIYIIRIKFWYFSKIFMTRISWENSKWKFWRWFYGFRRPYRVSLGNDSVFILQQRSLDILVSDGIPVSRTGWVSNDISNPYGTARTYRSELVECKNFRSTTTSDIDARGTFESQSLCNVWTFSKTILLYNWSRCDIWLLRLWYWSRPRLLWLDLHWKGFQIPKHQIS